MQIGDWKGFVVEAPTAAVALLRPNFLESRRYRNSVTGEEATLTIVQCREPRDMTGHYPPNCYPANGWGALGEASMEIAVGEVVFPVEAYDFVVESFERYERISVYNFFVRPDGRIERGETGVRQAAADRRLKVFGAAQVQVVFGSAVSADRREFVFQTLIEAAMPIIDEIKTGVPK